MTLMLNCTNSKLHIVTHLPFLVHMLFVEDSVSALHVLLDTQTALPKRLALS